MDGPPKTIACLNGRQTQCELGEQIQRAMGRSMGSWSRTLVEALLETRGCEDVEPYDFD